MSTTDEKVKHELDRAIETMRNACDAAARHAEDGNAAAIRRVLHDFSWGMANASNSIAGAMSELEHEHAMLLHSATALPPEPATTPPAAPRTR